MYGGKPRQHSLISVLTMGCKCSTWFWKVIKAITLIGCASLFVVMSWGIFEQFKDKNTVISETHVMTDSFESPVMVFCASNPYPNGTKMFVSKEHYLENSVDLNELIYRIKYVGDEASSHKMEDWDLQDIYSVFRGRCRAIRYKRKVRTILKSKVRHFKKNNNS